MYQKNYDDILYLSHHVSKVHPRMNLTDRAAQFAPFAALNGHDEAIKETARIVEQKLDLDEYQKEKINEKLNIIRDNIKHNPLVSIVYFQKDPKKIGGVYLTLISHVQKIDEYEHFIILENDVKVLFVNIYDIYIHSQ